MRCGILENSTTSARGSDCSLGRLPSVTWTAGSWDGDIWVGPRHSVSGPNIRWLGVRWSHPSRWGPNAPDDCVVAWAIVSASTLAFLWVSSALTLLGLCSNYARHSWQNRKVRYGLGFVSIAAITPKSIHVLYSPAALRGSRLSLRDRNEDARASRGVLRET